MAGNSIGTRPKNRFSKGDFFVLIGVAALLALSVILLLSGKSGKTVSITCDGSRVTYSLSEDRRIELTSNGYTLSVEIRNGEVSVTESDCPDRTCVRTGKIGKAGQTIICIPAKIVIEVTGGGTDEDFVIG